MPISADQLVNYIGKLMYKKGDYVIIDKIFHNVPHGHWIKTSEKIALIEKVEVTPSMGTLYTLSIDNETLKVMYTNKDIIKKYEEDPDAIWIMWGDI